MKSASTLLRFRSIVQGPSIRSRTLQLRNAASSSSNTTPPPKRPSLSSFFPSPFQRMQQEYEQQDTTTPLPSEDRPREEVQEQLQNVLTRTDTSKLPSTDNNTDRQIFSSALQKKPFSDVEQDWIRTKQWIVPHHARHAPEKMKELEQMEERIPHMPGAYDPRQEEKVDWETGLPIVGQDDARMENINIHGYSEEGGFDVNGTLLKGSIFVTRGSALLWRPRSWNDVTPTDLALITLMTPLPDTIIFGTGGRTRQLSPELLDWCAEHGFMFEVSDSGNAAATFNILNDEDRMVVGAFIAVDPEEEHRQLTPQQQSVRAPTPGWLGGVR